MGVPLLERTEVVATVTELVESASAGRGGVLFVEGEAGLGKTSILQLASEIATSGPSAGLRVGSGQGAVMEASLPFGLLDQSLADVGGPRLAAKTGGKSARAEQLYRLLTWLETANRGVLLALDDVHWADSDTLELVALLSRRISSLPVAIIATLRAWPNDALDVATALVAAGTARLRRLSPLSRDMSQAMLTERSGRSVSHADAERAWELCAGNPLLLEQLALAIGDGIIDGDASGAWPALEPDSLLLSRFAGLPQATLDCARAASVLGVRFRFDVAADVAGLPREAADRAVDALSRTGLIEQTTACEARFVHPLFAQALYDDLPGPLRARLHIRSFEVLAERGLDAEAVEHATRAGLGNVPGVVDALERAGRAALEVGAFETAAAQLTAAVGFAGDQASTPLIMSQAEALSAVGDPIASSAAYERVLSRGGLTAEVRAAALRMRGRALYASGDHVTAAACFADATELLLADHPQAAAEVLVDQALTMRIVLGPRGGLPVARRAVELAADASDRSLRLRAAASHGLMAVLAGDPSGIEATSAASRAAHANPRPELADPAWTWSLESIHAHAAKFLEQFDVAARGFRSVRAAAERSGAGEAVTMSLIGEAEVAARCGRLHEALELSERADGLTELVPLGATDNAVVRFLVLLHLDRPAEAAGYRRQLEELLDDRDEGTSRAWLLHLNGITHLGLGQQDAASDVYLQIEQLFDRLGIGEPCVVPWAGRAVIAHARAGRHADAARVLRWLDSCGARLPCRYPRVAAAFGRAEMARRDGDHRASERHYREALTIHEGGELPMERISTLLSYGNMLCQNGQPSRGRRILAEALESAEVIGAPALARYAREELSSAGGRRRRSAGSRLTPQELRIARLARTGSSRRDIAERLTLSQATVRTHLQHIYAKLDIHSARELMTADLEQLSDGGAP